MLRHAASLALLSVVALWVYASPAEGAVPTPPTLTLLSGDGNFDFGSRHDPQAREFIFSITPALPAGQRLQIRPVDLTSDGHAISARQMTVGRRILARRRALRVVVRIDPTGSTPRQYSGVLPIIAGGRVVEKVPLTAKIRSEVRSAGWTAVLAAVLILAGAAAGAVLKWLSETGSRLQSLENRFERVAAVIGSARVPTGLRRTLVSVQGSLDALDAAHAERHLAQVESHLDSILLVGSEVERLIALIAIERRDIDQFPDDEDARRLAAVAERLTLRLNEALENSWPDPSKHAQDRKTLADEIRVFAAFLSKYSDANNRRSLQPAIVDLESGDVEAAKQKMEHARAPQPEILAFRATREELLAATAFVAVGAGADVVRRWSSGRRRQAAPVTGHVTPPDDAPGRRSGLARFAVRYAGSITGAIIAAAVTLIGLTLLYFPNETFGSAQDWLTLLLWGFGVQLGGFSLAQLGGRALGTGPRITEPARP